MSGSDWVDLWIHDPRNPFYRDDPRGALKVLSVRASMVVWVQESVSGECDVMFVGGTWQPVCESATEVKAKVTSALARVRP